MCGIVAISASPRAVVNLESSLNAIRHRGPDGHGVFASEHRDCHLGHVRLAVVDLSTAGQQPMADTTGRFLITYNGEVYNFRELQAALEKRHGAIQWRSRTDTEIIVEGFAREGVEFLDRLNGIFALAIYDRKECQLHVLRDPLGNKPLFVTEQGGAVYFCSEVKGLLALPAIKATLRHQSLADQLSFMYVPEPHTMYSEIQKVEPGVCFSYCAGRRIGSRALFAHLNDPIHLSSEEDAVEHLRLTLTKAVERQIVADVPVSLLLSGGLDSSAIAYLAARSGARIEDAYTIAVSDDDRRNDPQGEDLHYARIMAKQLGLNLRVIPAQESFLDLLPQLAHSMEDGFTDPAAINTYLISKAAREAGVKVLLSGQGADEYLGGYRRYQAENLLQSLPAPLRLGLAALGRLATKTLPYRLSATQRRLIRLASLAGQSPHERLRSMYTWTAPEIIQSLLIEPVTLDGVSQFKDMVERYTSCESVDAMMKVDRHYDLMSLNLCYTDRMSMTNGVEVRTPFLDFDLVRLMNAIPLSMKIRNWQGKYVLKKSMAGWLPKEIIYREKSGFDLPIRAWLSRGNQLLETYLDESRIEKQGLFKTTAINQLIREQHEGTFDHAYTLFTLLCQQIWLESVPARN